MTAGIAAQGIGKRFHHVDPRRPMSLQELIARGFRRRSHDGSYWALRDVTVSVGNGELVGVVGRNGAGKSTLLRILAGAMHPDEGSVEVNGHLSTLLEIGSGFHPDLTGRENVFVNGVIAGLTKNEVRTLFDWIVDFAELGDFIDDPLRTYSSGMRMRLAFAVSVAVQREPDVILVDEVFSVGDFAFQQKCVRRMREFQKQGCAVLLASHDHPLVGSICDRLVWLNGGRVAADGPPGAVLHRYTSSENVGPSGPVAAAGS